MPYKIIQHGSSNHRAIKCLRIINGKECGAISYHPKDIERKHCSVCHYFHPEVSGEVVPVWDEKGPGKINPNLSFIYYD